MSARISVMTLALLGCRQDQASAPIAPFAIDEAVELGGQVLTPAAVKARVARVALPGRGGMVYCAYQALGSDRDRAYLWALCNEYAPGHDEAMSGTSLPVVVERDAILVPRDGGGFRQDLQRMFPARLIPQLLAGPPLENARVEVLDAAIQRERASRSR